MINDYLSRKYIMSQLDTTLKGKLINQIELILSNAFYICLNTFTKLSFTVQYIKY